MTEHQYPNIMKYFAYDHLPNHLQDISRSFFFLATKVCMDGKDKNEVEQCLRKLLEAKDCAVRSAL